MFLIILLVLSDFILKVKQPQQQENLIEEQIGQQDQSQVIEVSDQRSNLIKNELQGNNLQFLMPNHIKGGDGQLYNYIVLTKEQLKQLYPNIDLNEAGNLNNQEYYYIFTPVEEGVINSGNSGDNFNANANQNIKENKDFKGTDLRNEENLSNSHLFIFR